MLSSVNSLGYSFKLMLSILDLIWFSVDFLLIESEFLLTIDFSLFLNSSSTFLKLLWVRLRLSLFIRLKLKMVKNILIRLIIRNINFVKNFSNAVILSVKNIAIKIGRLIRLYLCYITFNQRILKLIKYDLLLGF